MGFLVVEAEMKNEVDDLGRALIRESRGLGVADRVMRHSASLTELARRGDWQAVRKELIATQTDVEQATIDAITVSLSKVALRGFDLSDVKSIHAQARGLNLAIRQINSAKLLATFGLA